MESSSLTRASEYNESDSEELFLCSMFASENVVGFALIIPRSPAGRKSEASGHHKNSPYWNMRNEEWHVSRFRAGNFLDRDFYMPRKKCWKNLVDILMGTFSRWCLWTRSVDSRLFHEKRKECENGQAQTFGFGKSYYHPYTRTT